MLRFCVALPLVLFLVGCQSNTSPDKVAKVAADEKHMAETSANLMGPLMPHCLAAVETGKVVSAATMAQLGFKPRGDGFAKPLGDSLIDRLNMSEVSFRAKSGECAMGGVAALPRVGGDFVAKTLTSRGYAMEGYGKATTGRGAGYLFVKGNTRIRLSGGAGAGGTAIILTRE